jgi:hypothetical protein
MANIFFLYYTRYVSLKTITNFSLSQKAEKLWPASEGTPWENTMQYLVIAMVYKTTTAIIINFVLIAQTQKYENIPPGSSAIPPGSRLHPGHIFYGAANCHVFIFLTYIC